MLCFCLHVLAAAERCAASEPEICAGTATAWHGVSVFSSAQIFMYFVSRFSSSSETNARPERGTRKRWWTLVFRTFFILGTVSSRGRTGRGTGRKIDTIKKNEDRRNVLKRRVASRVCRFVFTLVPGRGHSDAQSSRQSNLNCLPRAPGTRAREGRATVPSSVRD